MIVEKNAYTNDQRNRLHFIQNCIYDGAGDIRWYTNEDGHKYYPLSNDLIAIQVFNDKGTPRSGPDIRIIDLFGKTRETYFVPNRVHHEISEKIPGGNLLVGTNAQLYEDRDDDTEDMIIEIDRNTKEVVKSWDLRDIFDKDRPRLWSESVNDWCHLNSIQFDSTDNTLLISSKLQYFISKIDYETGEIKWILGSHKDWEQPWQPYLLTPTNFETESGPDQDFTFAQHMARLTYDGTILVYDNGASRPGDDYTRAVEFSVDSDEMTVTKVWEYIIPYVATFMGSIHLYEDGSVQIGHGAGDRIYEVSREGNILFQAKTKTYYRAYSINLY